MIKYLALKAFTRTRRQECSTIVLHSTDGKSASSSVEWLSKIGLSYHYIIERDGHVYKLAPVSRVAFHAGVSSGPEGNNVNEYSIGIAFANYESGKEPITLGQVKAAKKLVAEIVASGAPIRWVTTHYAISPGRKTDPAMLLKAELKEIAGTVPVWGVKL